MSELWPLGLLFFFFSKNKVLTFQVNHLPSSILIIEHMFEKLGYSVILIVIIYSLSDEITDLYMNEVTVFDSNSKLTVI